MRREAPPSRDYLKDKSVKNKTAKRAGLAIVALLILFGLFIGKWALSNPGGNLLDGLPDSDTAYGVAKQFILPTVRGSNPVFNDDNYQFAKKSDSVYVIKSSYSTKFDDGENQETRFTISLKYNGGMSSKTSNWTLINLDQDN
ncbi:hypothetical protein [Mucilaginibacter sp. 44-25]|uniref:hypothetical protein n=1 Tax=Mucilaginibacter sp. 44-25 TaxID=1895794 RepID=UPI00095FAEA6|nr:hypothetical protein [Mucilaginibacter sp. 44-25]OJW18107.1 MAG: hypothetical protein BGO48_16150 [Mucilaginibacter sp. 44-25]